MQLGSETRYPTRRRYASNINQPVKCFTVFVGLIVMFTISLSAKDKKEKIPLTSIHSFTNPEYQRERLPDGTWKMETYTLGFGESLDPSDSDESLTTLTNEEMAVILYEPLLKESYRPERKEGEIDLLIIVRWGKTIPPGESGTEATLKKDLPDDINRLTELNVIIETKPDTDEAIAAENEKIEIDARLSIHAMMQSQVKQMRREANNYNANILGYAPNINQEYRTANDTLGFRQDVMQKLIEEIEMERYFVILQAFDFQKLVKNKEKDLQWMTRFSIRAQGRDFNEEFAKMADAASTFFGRDSGKMKRRIHPGKAQLGELEVVEAEVDEEESQE